MVFEGRQSARRPPEMSEVWARIKAVLLTGDFTDILLGAGRVWVVTDEWPARAGRDDKPWGRLLIIPQVTAWTRPEEAGNQILVPFLIRTDWNKPVGSDFDVTRWSDVAHDEAYRLLHGLTITDMERAHVSHPIHRELAPQPVPVWEDRDGVWWRSALYHMYVEPKPL